MFSRKHNTSKPILLSDTNSLGHFGESLIPIHLSNTPPILPSTQTLYNQPLLKPHPSMLFPSNYLPYSTPFYSLLIHQPTLYIDCTPLSSCKDALCLGPHLLFLQQQALHTPSSLYPCSIRYSLYSCRGDHHSIVGFRQEWLPTVGPPPSYYLSGLSSLPFIWIPIDTITSFPPYSL